MRLGEGGEEAEGQEEVGDAPRAGGRDVVLDDVVVRGAEARDGAGDEARLVGYGGARVGDLHGAAIGDGFEETQERDLMRGEAGIRGRVPADLGYVDGPAGQRRKYQPAGERLVACELEKFWSRGRHGCVFLEVGLSSKVPYYQKKKKKPIENLSNR